MRLCQGRDPDSRVKCKTFPCRHTETHDLDYLEDLEEYGTKDHKNLWTCFKHLDNPELALEECGISWEEWGCYSAKFGRCRRLEAERSRLEQEIEQHKKWFSNLNLHLTMKYLDEHPEERLDPVKRQMWIEGLVLHPDDAVAGGENNQASYSKQEAWNRAKYWFNLWTHLNMKEVDEHPELVTQDSFRSYELFTNGFISPRDYHSRSRS